MSRQCYFKPPPTHLVEIAASEVVESAGTSPVASHVVEATAKVVVEASSVAPIAAKGSTEIRSTEAALVESSEATANVIAETAAWKTGKFVISKARNCELPKLLPNRLPPKLALKPIKTD